jgi:hypothetical protein
MFLSFLLFETKSVEISELVAKVQSIRSDIEMITAAVAEERTQAENSGILTRLFPKTSPMVCTVEADGSHHCYPKTSHYPIFRNSEPILCARLGDSSTTCSPIRIRNILNQPESNLAIRFPYPIRLPLRNSGISSYRAFTQGKQVQIPPPPPPPPPNDPHDSDCGIRVTYTGKYQLKNKAISPYRPFTKPGPRQTPSTQEWSEDSNFAFRFPYPIRLPLRNSGISSYRAFTQGPHQTPPTQEWSEDSNFAFRFPYPIRLPLRNSGISSHTTLSGPVAGGEQPCKEGYLCY